MDWDSYNTRINIRGTTPRDRDLSYLKQSLEKSVNSLSCKKVLINNIERDIIFDSISSTNTVLNEYVIKAIPNETFTLGQMVVWNNANWLINDRNIDDEVYTKGTLVLCPFTLKFQLNSQILSYPYYVISNSPSLDENKYIITSDTIRKIKLPFDNNTKMLKTDMRFMGDTFGDGKPQCWKITDLALDKGLLQLTDVRDEYNDSTDNIELGICNYSVLSPTPSEIIITGVSTITKLSTATFTANSDVTWSVSNLDESDNVYVSQSDITDTSIKLTAVDIVGKYIILTATSQVDTELVSNKTVQIVGLF